MRWRVYSVHCGAWFVTEINTFVCPPHKKNNFYSPSARSTATWMAPGSGILRSACGVQNVRGKSNGVRTKYAIANFAVLIHHTGESHNKE